ncbi:DUF3306 domain-containing protein [Roseibium alexandrii]|jgi:hypothetical protein|uniref:DUF3306 domain-containing protein n=1 Tax=Roseibium alexandrii (strain DSM 17067 / NCIMB 14079 / DFL-11) TaxID=244592 RepID=A0A5E8GWE3_ROSAD|nr:DUF3306 domain-containing protein [Roseibium alexandrii]EEE44285.1 Protein of unknown function (DUF3306) [Roseibium alexandrii DFL-11]
MTGDEKSGMDFWSRRKAAVQRSEELERVLVEEAEVAKERAELETKSDAEILEELNLPDPDTLTENDDFSQFLSAAVPERLKRRALRRLWGLNPVLANLDGLVDYADDFTDAATVVSNMQTVYQVGRGMVERFVEGAEEEAVEEFADEISDPVEENERNAAVQDEQNTAEQHNCGENEEALVQLTQGEALLQDMPIRDEFESSVGDTINVEAEPPQRPRRMRFDYS